MVMVMMMIRRMMVMMMIILIIVILMTGDDHGWYGRRDRLLASPGGPITSGSAEEGREAILGSPDLPWGDMMSLLDEDLCRDIEERLEDGAKGGKEAWGGGGGDGWRPLVSRLRREAGGAHALAVWHTRLRPVYGVAHVFWRWTRGKEGLKGYIAGEQDHIVLDSGVVSADRRVWHCQLVDVWTRLRAVPAFELAILRAIFHSKGPKA
jgi:hypothetical protein